MKHGRAFVMVAIWMRDEQSTGLVGREKGQLEGKLYVNGDVKSSKG